MAGTTDDDLSEAWTEAGAALRRAHGLRPFGEAGVITGRGLEPFERPWGEYHANLIRGHGKKLRALERIDATQLARIEAAATFAARALASLAQAGLLHNDPHGANVLIRKDRGHWRLAAWIDWEYAWMGDPQWDLARFEIFTRAQVGTVDEGFWAGYGTAPDPQTFPFYELHAMVWLGSLRHTRPTALTAIAQAYVRDIDSHLDVLGV